MCARLQGPGVHTVRAPLCFSPQHMVTTVQHLLDYHDRQRAAVGLEGPSRCVLWAHNSHLGDCRATGLSRQREVNVGQLVRERWGMEGSFSVGFTTYAGTVSAARKWGAEREDMTLNPALPGSYESVFHIAATSARTEAKDEKQQEADAEAVDFAIVLRSNGDSRVHRPAVAALEPRRLERAVGVQYVKKTERESHYIECCLPSQFDYVIHVDTTSALVSAEGKASCR